MEKGDISNEVPPRFIFVWDNLMGELPNKTAVAKERAARRMHLWRAAVNCWTFNERIVDHAWDIAWRYSYALDIVTHRPPGFRDALVERLDEANIPYGHVYSMTTQQLVRRLPHMPYVVRVFHGDPKQIFTYGSRARYVRYNGLGFSPFV